MSSEGISNINFVNFSDEPNDEAEKYSEKQLITESGFFNKIQTSRQIFTTIIVLIVIIVTFIFVGIVFAATKASTFDVVGDGTNVTDTKIQIGGSYVLNHIDDKFEEYLTSLGFPKFVVHLIKETKEVITITEPTQTNPNWTLVLTTEFSTHKVEFEVGKKLEQSIGGRAGAVIQRYCERPEYQILICTVKEPSQNWNLRSRLIFTKEGLTDEKTNLNKNVSTNKTYIRVSNSEGAADESGLVSDQTTPFPGMTTSLSEDFGWE